MKFIATSDWHLRADAPLCRTDPDWMETQRLNIREVISIANKYDCPILNGGDIFDVPRTPPNVVAMLLQELNALDQVMYLIGGNHSIQYHKQEFLYESSLGILAAMIGYSKLKYLTCEDRSVDGRFEHYAPVDPNVVMIHTLTVPSCEEIMFGMKAQSAYQLMETYVDWKYLVTGDNHTSFVVDDEEHYVINPGSLNIQTADAKDRTPCVYLVDTDKETIKKIDLTPFHEYITDNHLVEKHQRDDRISAFVETIKQGGKVSLNFDDNLTSTLSTMEVSPALRGIFDELKEEV